MTVHSGPSALHTHRAAGGAAIGWLPIETAPRDGTIILLWCPGGIDRLYASPGAAHNVCLGFYGDSGGIYRTEGWWSVESREEIWGYGSEMTGPMTETECLKAAPSHWMQLPAAPDTPANAAPGGDEAAKLRSAQ